MKNTLFKITSFLSLVVLLGSQSLQAQDGKKISIDINGGINFSDLNYGHELFNDLFDREDYLNYFSGGIGHYGYYFGVGTSFTFSPHFSGLLSADFNSLRYKIEGEVSDLSPAVTRPPSSTIPISAEGKINYSFLGLNAGVRYSLSDDPGKGIFVSVLAKHMIYLSTSWQTDVTYEDLSTGQENDISVVEEPEYNNLWFIGIDLGYNLLLNENLTIAPKIDFKYGLNPIVEDTIGPTIIEAGISLKKWF